MRGLRAAVVLCCILLSWVVGMQTARAQESFIFSFPPIPDSLITVDSRATHLVDHYWDNAVFPPSLSAADNDSVEQAWVNYCDLFRLTHVAVARRSLARLVGRKDVPAVFLMSLAEKYLFDTTSPCHNEDAYMGALEAFMARQDIDTLYRVRYASQLHMLAHCLEGATVANFDFESAEGVATLYGLSAPWMLLVVYDPECEHCQEVVGWLAADAHVTALLASGKFAILSVDVGEGSVSGVLPRTRKGWVDTHHTIPSIVEDNSYDLRTLPLCLLLDGDKRVVAKTSTLSALKDRLLGLGI